MGFEPNIREILQHIPGMAGLKKEQASVGTREGSKNALKVSKTSKVGTQVLLFTATWPKEVASDACSAGYSYHLDALQVQGLAAEYVFRPIHIRIGKSEQLNACRTVEQVVQIMQEQQKTAKLLKLLATLREEGGSERDNAVPLKAKVLIFVNRKVMCGKLVVSLRNHGFLADCIHGDRPQQEGRARKL